MVCVRLHNAVFVLLPAICVFKRDGAPRADGARDCNGACGFAAEYRELNCDLRAGFRLEIPLDI